MYPHLPAAKSQRCFNAMVTAMDESVGAIYSALKGANGGKMYRNSIIVYSSDNGEYPLTTTLPHRCTLSPLLSLTTTISHHYHLPHTHPSPNHKADLHKCQTTCRCEVPSSGEWAPSVAIDLGVIDLGPYIH
jgi:arylsulfatase A-like enzyme